MINQSLTERIPQRNASHLTAGIYLDHSTIEQQTKQE